MAGSLPSRVLAVNRDGWLPAESNGTNHWRQSRVVRSASRSSGAGTYRCRRCPERTAHLPPTRCPLM
jgi:hypothetical protein